jgi:hypothetical protein
MSFQPYSRIPSGIVYFGTPSSDSLYESDSNFTIGGGYLSASNIKLQNNGTLGSNGTPNAITIASDGDVSIYGNLTVNGTTTTVNSTTVLVEDPIILLGSGSPSTDDNKDRGISFNYYDGTAKKGFFGYDDSISKFIFVTGASIVNEIVSGTKGIIVADIDGSAASLTNGRYIQVSNQISGSGMFDGSSDLNISVALTADAITDQTEATVAYDDHYFLVASGTSLRKISKSNFANLAMSNFTITDGTTSQQIDNGEGIYFIDSDTIDFTVAATNFVSGVVKNNSITESKRSRTVETVTSSKTIDKDITLADCTSGNLTLSLPENDTAGKIVVVKRIDSSANNVIISRTGSDTIDGSTEFRLYHIYETLTVVSNGANWYII